MATDDVDEGARYKNCDLLPTQVSDFPWLYEKNETYNHLDCDDVGKWMIFVPASKVDQLWLRAKSFYNSGQLPGIFSMKVSTLYKNPRASGSDLVLILYCGPASNEASVMACGEVVKAKLVPGDYPNPYLYYKSDAQTMLGTKATGQKKNWLYRLKLKP